MFEKENPDRKHVLQIKQRIRIQKVFNLTPGVNDPRFLLQNESCDCKCILNEGVCNSKQKWNHNECWCNCKELDDWVLVKRVICRIVVHVIVNVMNPVKLMSM